MWIAQISYLMTVTARIAAQVSFQHLWSLSSWNRLHTEQVTYTRCVMCNKIQFGALWYELLLNEWQPRITRRYSHEKNVSNKKEHFSLTLVPRLTMVLLSLHYFLPIRRPVLGNQLLSTQKGGSQAWGLSWHGKGGGSCEHEGAVPAFGRWTVCQWVDKNRSKQFLKCWWAFNEVGSRYLEKHGRWRAILRAVIN